MQCFSPFRLIAADKVPAGSLVVLCHKRVPRTVALAVRRGDRSEIDFLMIAPTSPEWNDRVGLTEGSFFGEVSVLAIPQAHAVVRGSPDAANFRPQYEHAPPGALSLREDGRMLITALVANQTAMMYALDNGEEFRLEAQALWFPAWDIMVPDVDGGMQPFCTVRAGSDQGPHFG